MSVKKVEENQARLLTDVATFAFCEGNTKSEKVRENTAIFLQALVEDTLDVDDWTVSDFKQALLVKLPHLLRGF